MGFSQIESKKIVDACLRNVAKVVKGKESGEEKLIQIKLQIELVDAVLKDTDKKKKKKSKKRKLSDDASTASADNAEPSK